MSAPLLGNLRSGFRRYGPAMELSRINQGRRSLDVTQATLLIREGPEDVAHGDR